MKAVRETLDLDADARLNEYHVDAITGGTDAAVIAEVTMSLGGRSVSVAALYTGIMQASVQAMVDAFDRPLALNHTSPTSTSADS